MSRLLRKDLRRRPAARAWAAAPLLLVLLLTACASSGERSERRSGGDVLTGEEIAEAGDRISTALEAIEHLRPSFLRTRPSGTLSGSSDPVRVYVDGMDWGDARSLSRLRATQVVRIRFIRPRDAQIRYGMNHSSGALEVTTRGR